MQTIAERKHTRAENSYVATLLRGGLTAIGGKVIEEARELVEAAQAGGGELDAAARSHLIHEAADLLFHMLVLLGCADVSLDDVRSELKRRQGTSGLAEKAGRTGAHS